MGDSWQQSAACKDRDGFDWFPHTANAGGVTADYRRNLAACRALCASCPVRRQCLTWALERGERGIWAGLTARERQALPTAREARVRVNQAECGTDSGYAKHLRWSKTTPCDECRAAHAQASRQRDYRQRGTG